MKVIAFLTHKRINLYELNFSVVYELTFHGEAKFIGGKNPHPVTTSQKHNIET